MNKYLLLPLIVAGFVFVISCNDAPSSNRQTILTGSVVVLVDESLAPIMRDQLEVFQHSYTHADIVLDIGPENQVVRKLVNGEAEIAVLTRLLSDWERKFFDEREFTPRVTKFATDAVALINNVASVDTVMTVEQLLSGLTGSGEHVIVFDNANSGTVRYLKELADIDSLPAEGVYALESNNDVIRYVHDHPGAIGVVGINWLIRPDSTTQPLMDQIRVLPVRNLPGMPGDDGYYLPSQTNLATGHYALSRPVYLINGEPRQGLGIGFAAFLAGDRGQRIILKSGLMPDSLPPRELILRKRK